MQRAAVGGGRGQMALQCGRGLAVQWGGACPACSRLRRARLFVTEMAEGELDVDSLISRLLEGKFETTFRLYRPDQFPVQSSTDFRHNLTDASLGEKVCVAC